MTVIFCKCTIPLILHFWSLLLSISWLDQGSGWLVSLALMMKCSYFVQFELLLSYKRYLGCACAVLFLWLYIQSIAFVDFCKIFSPCFFVDRTTFSIGLYAFHHRIRISVYILFSFSWHYFVYTLFTVHVSVLLIDVDKFERRGKRHHRTLLFYVTNLSFSYFCKHPSTRLF